MRSERIADIVASILGAALLLLVAFLVVSVPVLGLGIAFGYALHALIPGLELGWALVAGAVFATGIVDMMARFLLAARGTRQTNEEEDLVGAEPWIRIPRSFLYPEPPAPRQRKRK